GSHEGGSGSAGSTCMAAGGTCVLGNVACSNQAPSDDQDCNPDRNHGGAFCCLVRDGGPSTCAGSAPNCFGDDDSQCCGQDPSGAATCTGGAWMCGSAKAPG